MSPSATLTSHALRSDVSRASLSFNALMPASPSTATIWFASRSDRPEYSSFWHPANSTSSPASSARAARLRHACVRGVESIVVIVCPLQGARPLQAHAPAFVTPASSAPCA
ncbi:uncharacterized protein BCN122_II2434 [Burkholderia cenocepacia]|nr:uncharacterized protein BCN122_II2434 [Burkholderia cenocepacia]